MSVLPPVNQQARIVLGDEKNIVVRTISLTSAARAKCKDVAANIIDTAFDQVDKCINQSANKSSNALSSK